jgi:hypothetical protein
MLRREIDEKVIDNNNNGGGEISCSEEEVVSSCRRKEKRGSSESPDLAGEKRGSSSLSFSLGRGQILGSPDRSTE